MACLPFVLPDAKRYTLHFLLPESYGHSLFVQGWVNEPSVSSGNKPWLYSHVLERPSFLHIGGIIPSRHIVCLILSQWLCPGNQFWSHQPNKIRYYPIIFQVTAELGKGPEHCVLLPCLPLRLHYCVCEFGSLNSWVLLYLSHKFFPIQEQAFACMVVPTAQCLQSRCLRSGLG